MISKGIKDKAISLRRSGASYSTIQKHVGFVSKSTLNAWFKKVEFSHTSIESIAKNKKISNETTLAKVNARRKTKILKENSESLLEGFNLVQTLSKRELMLIGAALYWGEGTKSEKSPISLRFTNSDTDMIQIFMRFIQEILCISLDKVRAGIHIHHPLQESGARDYWSHITKLPRDRFYIVTQQTSASQNRRPYNNLRYGTIVIRINNRIPFFKIKGMIEGIKKNI